MSAADLRLFFEKAKTIIILSERTVRSADRFLSAEINGRRCMIVLYKNQPTDIIVSVTSVK